MSSKDGKKYYYGGWKLTAVLVVLAVLASLVLLNPFGIGVEIPDEEMKIAVLLPLSGDYETEGKVYLAGIETAQKELEKRGISYELVIYDTRGDPVEASRALFDVYDSGIPVVIGPLTSDEVISVSSYAEVLGIVVLSPGATSQRLESYNDYTYKLKPTDKYLARGFATLFEEKFEITAPLAENIQNIVVVYDSSLCELTMFQSYYEAVEEAKNESEVIRKMDISTHPFNDTDDAAAYLLETKPDCVILFINNQNTSLELMKKTEAAGLNPFWLGEESLLLSDMSSLGNQVSNKVIVLAPLMKLTNPLYSFEAVETGEVPRSAPIQYGYDAMMVINDAVQSNGYSAEGVKKGLDYLRTVGLTGTIAFDKSKTRYPGYDILVWRGGDAGWENQ